MPLEFCTALRYGSLHVLSFGLAALDRCGNQALFKFQHPLVPLGCVFRCAECAARDLPMFSKWRKTILNSYPEPEQRKGDLRSLLTIARPLTTT